MKKINSNRIVRIMFGVGIPTPKWVLLEIFKKLPNDAAIINIVTDVERHQYGWIVSSEKFNPVEDGAVLPPAFVKVDGITKTVDLHFEATADSFADALSGL
jgi:hypothetical protein